IANIVASINNAGNLCMTFTTGTEFVDSVLVIATEFGTDDLYTDSAWQIIRYSSDNAPVLSGIVAQTIAQNESFVAFDLDDFLTEYDNDTVLFSVSDTNNLTIAIDSNNVVSISVQDPNWYGSDTIRFTVVDSTVNQFTDYIDVIYKVVPAINVSGIEDQQINFGESFTTIDLLNHIDYPYLDSIAWEVTSNELIGIVNYHQFDVYFSTVDWKGIDTLYVKAFNINDNSIFDIDTVIFAVIVDMNEAPTAITLSNDSILENLSVGTTIGLLATTDADSADTHTYEIVESPFTDYEDFGIVNNELKSYAVFDFEEQNIYLIDIKSTDEAGLEIIESFVIYIGNDPEIGIAENSSEATISTYPNPATDYITIAIEQRQATVIIYNLAGKAVITARINNYEAQIDLRKLAAGTYTVVVDQKTVTKIVVNR
ncbi:MAG: T9SS type A sorting domain-containing protein, partial [Flavobacteriales bacterium]|nr:T9SS type A sorting domain-containing protein [Flavobacteriales bacterium]